MTASQHYWNTIYRWLENVLGDRSVKWGGKYNFEAFEAFDPFKAYGSFEDFDTFQAFLFNLKNSKAAGEHALKYRV